MTTYKPLVPWKEAANPSAIFVVVPDYDLPQMLDESQRKKRLDILLSSVAPPLSADEKKKEGEIHARIYRFKYKSEVFSENKNPLDESTLQARAQMLSDELCRVAIGNIPIVLVGYGCGGLICEQAALLCEKNQKEVIHSVILVGTPHFKGGFAQWVGLCVGSKPTEESAPWKTCEKSVSKIVEMVQRKFRAAFVRDNSRIHVACCIAAKAGDTSKAVSPDWCMLPGSWVLELPATYEQMTSFTSAVDYDEVYKMVQKWITEADIPRTPSAASSPPAAPELERVVRPQSQFYAYPPHRQDMLAVGSVVATAEDMELLARPQDIRMALQPSSSNARLSARPPHHHPTGRTSRAPAAPMRRCDSDASVHTLQGLSLTDSPEGPGGIQARNNRGCMISQETAIQYARGASKLQPVREHIRATGRAYLVVGNGAAAAEGTGKEGEMEGVRLWEVKCTPSRRNSRESVASLVA